jgi:hypothetical protein
METCVKDSSRSCINESGVIKCTLHRICMCYGSEFFFSPSKCVAEWCCQLLRLCGIGERWRWAECGSCVEWCWQGNGVLGEKPVLVPLCPPQIACGLLWDWTGAFGVSGQLLATWAKATACRLFLMCQILEGGLLWTVLCASGGCCCGLIGTDCNV